MLRVEPELEAQYVADGTMRLAFHPILDLGAASLAAATAVECAALQQPAAYWTLRRQLFERQNDLYSATPDFYAAAAAELGLDAAALQSCMADAEIAAKIERLDQERREAGIRLRPTFDLNSRRIEGALPLDLFRSAIDEAAASSP